MSQSDFDVVIRDGSVIDGTGAPARHADVAIRDGRIAAIGEVDGSGEHELDADGRVVCPGFVDVHTHLDAQAFWDPALSPSPLHGVTTAIAGNCGFTHRAAVAVDGRLPHADAGEGRGDAARVTSHVGVPWDWSTTSEYLDRLDGTLAINTGFMVGHSAIRRLVMGRGGQRARRDRRRSSRTMQGVLRDGLAAGGTRLLDDDVGHAQRRAGRPVPSRFADEHEFVELARVCGEFAGTSLELLPRGATDLGPFDDDVAELMIRMSEVPRGAR